MGTVEPTWNVDTIGPFFVSLHFQDVRPRPTGSSLLLSFLQRPSVLVTLLSQWTRFVTELLVLNNSLSRNLYSKIFGVKRWKFFFQLCFRYKNDRIFIIIIMISEDRVTDYGSSQNYLKNKILRFEVLFE